MQIKPPIIEESEERYTCVIPFKDGFADYKVGDELSIGYIDFRGDNAFVMPVSGHPIILEAFNFCFKRTT